MHARPLGRPVGAVLCLAFPALAAAQVPNIRVSGRVQAHYRAAGGDASGVFDPDAVTNAFEIRRLRIQTDVRFGDAITLVIQPSFEMAALRMRDAYLRVGLAPRLGMTMGQEKSPFQRYELTSSNALASIERGVRILGLSGREGLNDLLVDNGYASHDLGAFLDYTAPNGRVTAKLGMQNGSRESTRDVNNAKSVFARVTAVALTNADDQPLLQLGASFAARDRAICSTCTGAIAYYADSSKTTTAVGLDLEWGGFRPGWHVIADFATGDNVQRASRVATARNTGNLRDGADTNVVTFVGVHVVGAYRLRTRGSDARTVQFVEPALRLDWTDPDVDSADDEGLLLTPALNVYFASTVVLRVAFDWYRYRDAGTSRTAREFKMSWQANF